MPGTEQVNRIAHQCEHFVASLDAAGMVLNLRATQVCAGHVDGIQEILNAAPVLDLKLTFDLLDR